MENINKALIVPFDQIKNKISRDKTPIMCKIDPIKYAEIAYFSLCKEDPRYMMVSESFKENVLFKALGMEILSKNKNTLNKESLIYPTFDSLLKGIIYFYKTNNSNKLNMVEYDLLNHLYSEMTF